MHAMAHRGCTDTCKRVCTERWLEEKSLVAPGNRTCIGRVLVRCSTNWATSPPQRKLKHFFFPDLYLRGTNYHFYISIRLEHKVQHWAKTDQEDQTVSKNKKIKLYRKTNQRMSCWEPSYHLPFRTLLSSSTDPPVEITVTPWNSP